MSNPYRKEIHGVSVDMYDIMDAYGVADYARCHAIKKLFCAGQRNGGKSKLQDLQEARWTIERAIEIEQARLKQADEVDDGDVHDAGCGYVRYAFTMLTTKAIDDHIQKVFLSARVDGQRVTVLGGVWCKAWCGGADDALERLRELDAKVIMLRVRYTDDLEVQLVVYPNSKQVSLKVLRGVEFLRSNHFTLTQNKDEIDGVVKMVMSLLSDDSKGAV